MPPAGPPGRLPNRHLSLTTCDASLHRDRAYHVPWLAMGQLSPLRSQLRTSSIILEWPAHAGRVGAGGWGFQP